MNFTRIAATAALITTASSAFAELTYSSSTLSYSNFEIFGESLTQTELSTSLNYQVGNILIGGNLEFLRIDESPGDFSITNGDISIGYQLGAISSAGGFMVGAILEGAKFEDEQTDTRLGLFLEYNTENFDLAVVSMEDVRFDSPQSFRNTLFLSYDVNQSLTARAAVLNNGDSSRNIYYVAGDYENGPVAVSGFYAKFQVSDDQIYGIRGSYDFNDRYSVNVSLVDDSDFIVTTSVGVGVNVTPEISLEIRFGKIEFDDIIGFAIDTVSFELTYEMGREGFVYREQQALFEKDFNRQLIFFF